VPEAKEYCESSPVINALESFMSTELQSGCKGRVIGDN
jgi:hypothetical protein